MRKRRRGPRRKITSPSMENVRFIKGSAAPAPSLSDVLKASEHDDEDPKAPNRPKGNSMQHWRYLETNEERAERQAKADAFWNRPQAEVMRDLVIREEDLPLDHRGGPYRQFRSSNMIDLVQVRKERR
jgi:hypothetical protein